MARCNFKKKVFTQSKNCFLQWPQDNKKTIITRRKAEWNKKTLGVLQTFLFERIFGGKNTEYVTGNGKQKQIMIKVEKKAMD